MAGAYNQNVIKEAEKLYSEHPKSKFFVIGEFGRKAFVNKGIPFENDFLYTAPAPHAEDSERNNLYASRSLRP